MPELKRAVKDSVFTYLFSQPEYARELYLLCMGEQMWLPVKPSGFAWNMECSFRF